MCFYFITLRGYDMTVSERVPCVPVETRACRRMVDHLSLGVHATRSGTRVFAFIVQTCSVGLTFGVHHALGPAPFVRVPIKLGQTRTRSGSVLFFANSVRTAR